MFLPLCLFTSDRAAAVLRHKNPFPPGSVFFHVFIYLYGAVFLHSNARPAGPAICAAQCLFRENLDGQLRRRSHCSNPALDIKGKTFHSNPAVRALGLAEAGELLCEPVRCMVARNKSAKSVEGTAMSGPRGGGGPSPPPPSSTSAATGPITAAQSASFSARGGAASSPRNHPASS